eukprot:812202-Pyramimonas_sp.AAC.1
MFVLLVRLLDRIRRPGVIPRALIDDISLQWTGDRLQGTAALWSAASEFKAGSALLGLVAQPSKSGFVASATEVVRAAKRHPGAGGLRART